MKIDVFLYDIGFISMDYSDKMMVPWLVVLYSNSCADMPFTIAAHLRLVIVERIS